MFHNIKVNMSELNRKMAMEELQMVLEGADSTDGMTILSGISWWRSIGLSITST